MAHRVQFSLSDIRYFVPPSQARGDIIAVRYIWGEVATVLCFLSVRRALLAIKGENIYPDCHENSILTVRENLIPHQLYVEVENVCHCSHFNLKFHCFAPYEGHIYRLEFAYMKTGIRFTFYCRLKYNFRNSTVTR